MPRSNTEGAQREREIARDRGVTLRPAFAHLIDLAAPGIGVKHARRMVRAIAALLARSGWTNSEYNQLFVARQKWQRRADGLDARYIIHGRGAGALRPTERAAVRELQALIDIQPQLDALIVDTQIAAADAQLRGSR